MHRLLVPVICLCLIAPALADPRPFTFTTDAYPMGKGEWEYEQWVTYSGTDTDRYDFRHELEFGITDNFDLAVYFLEWRHQDGAEDEFEYRGGAVEAIVHLLNPVTDKIGLSLYGEIKVREHELVIENKLILQKDIGKWILAYNFVVESEIEGIGDEDAENEVTGELKHTFGAAYAISSSWLLGGEAFVTSVYSDWESHEVTTLYAGPVVSYQGGKIGDEGFWWVTFTPTFQITDEEDEPDMQARLIFGLGW
jgi:hypothetical protein